MRDLPRDYIARGGEVAWIGPSGFRDARLYGFAIKANRTLVHEMFSRYIGEPSRNLGLHIDVRGTTLEHVLFVFVDSERHQISKGPGSEGSYREQLFAVVALGYRRSPDPGLVLFAPYLYVSDTPGWEADREIYGYPRQQGSVRMDSSAGVVIPQWLSVGGRVIKKFQPDAMSQDLEFLRIVRKPNPAQRQPIRSESEIFQTISRVLGTTHVEPRGHCAGTIVPFARHGVTEADIAFFKRTGCRLGDVGPSHGSREPINLEGLLKGSLPMLFLKQFRDIAYADRACYQAIVEAPLEIKGKVADFTGQDYLLELADFDSVPIGRELGIPAERQIDVDFAFRIDVDRMCLREASVISNPQWNPAIEVSTPDEPSRLPIYVDRGGEAVWRQPSLLFGARIYGFGVSVPLERQQATLDRYINSVAEISDSTYGSQPFHLRPCRGVEIVMLLFVEYERITSGNPDDRSLGGTSYREFLATQLAISDDLEYPELDWFIPYIVLNTDSPRLGGREIFGYPKQLGTIEPFQRYPGGALDPAKTLGMKTTIIRKSGKDSAERGVTVVEVIGPPMVPGTKPYTNPQDMFWDLWGSSRPQADDASLMGRLFPHVPLGASSGPGVDVIAALLTNGVGDVFLKEFRDCLNPKHVCYQAVCKTDTIPAKLHSGGCVDPSGYEIKIQDFASEPLLSQILGGPESGRMTTTPKFAYWLDIDLELTSGRVIANPLAANYSYSPDISLKTTRPKKRKRRVSPFAEPFWAR